MDTQTGRQIKVRGMTYAPTNEQGVVFLFGRLAPALGFTIEQVQVRCPDCTALRRGKRHRIEFEYRASHYFHHRHDPTHADIVVCWENDWAARPHKYKHIEIIDLKQYAGADPRIFSVGCKFEENARDLSTGRTTWNVPRNTQVGDLVLIYRSYAKPHAIHDAWIVVGPFEEHKKGNKDEMWPGLQTSLRRIAKFDNPITYEQLKLDRRTRELGIVKGRFQSKRDISGDWPILHDFICQLNPRIRKSLSKWQLD